ncbi:MAG: efflux RND transporter periplasmic adaptor subunit [Paracoccaceae bacterium]|nr:efflux RND transporter periplasmic adaptor subunit [Paracoccaceae bacterium]
MSEPSIEETLRLGRHGRSWMGYLGYGAAAAAVLLGGWYLFLRPDAAAAVQYATAEAGIRDFSVVVTATGTVEPTNLVEISSELSGTLETVNVDFNDTVEEGTILAELDTTKLEAQLAVQQAALEAAIARVAMAKATLEDARYRYVTGLELGARGITAEQALVTQETTLARAEAEMQSALADQKLAEANLRLQEAELAQACICSPIKGVILDRAADKGQIVASSLSAPVLFTVAEDLTEMELRVDIDEADIGLVAVGNAAEFTVDAYDDRVFPAEIAEIRFAPETVDGVVTYKAILTIDNADLLLRPGMTATADITVAEVTGALTVPNAALRYAPPAAAEEAEDRAGLLGMLIPEGGPDAAIGDARTVWVLRDGAAEELPLETGLTNGTLTEILGGDLAPGDVLITERLDG